MSAFGWCNRSYRLFCMSFVFRSCRNFFMFFANRRFFCFTITSFFINIFHEIVVNSFVIFFFFFVFRRFFFFTSFWFSRFIFFFPCIFTRSYRSFCMSIFAWSYRSVFVFFTWIFCITTSRRFYSCTTIIYFCFFLWPNRCYI